MKRIAVILLLFGWSWGLFGLNGPIRPVMMEDRRYVHLADAAAFYGWEFYFHKDGRSVILRGAGHELHLNAGSAAGTISKVRLAMLDKAMVAPSGMFVVSDRDLQKTLLPFLMPGAVPPSPVRRVLIDAGHGGHDPGAVREGLQEKSVNLALALKIAALLKNRGVEVELTRPGDEFYPLDERADQVRLRDGDLFLSIHQNAAVNTSAAGVEVYFAPSNRYAAASMHLAHAVAYHILHGKNHVQPVTDRGIKRARFRVLCKADCPAVLVECGFLSNPADRARMTQETYLNTFAGAVVDGIMAYRILAGPAKAKEEQER